MKKKKKHFLVTGGMGFIGSAICELLINQGYKITIFDDGSSSFQDHSDLINATLENNSICDPFNRHVMETFNLDNSFSIY